TRQSGVVAARAQKVFVENGGAGVAVAETAELKNSLAGVLVANTVNTTGSRSLVLIAGNVNGPVETVLDLRRTQSVLLAGLSAGLVVGLIFLLRSWFSRPRK
ncbi:MAG: hypothetical protein AAB658_05845, partial [Chloroflexota bacterium]